MDGYLIETRYSPRHAWEEHANFRDTRPKAKAYGESLLKDMRERFPKAGVRVGGKVVRVKRRIVKKWKLEERND